MIEQLAWQGVLPHMTHQEAEKVVKKMLRGYKLLDGKIKIRERQSMGKGIGFYFTVNTSTPQFKEDKLQALHAKLRDLPEEEYLSKNELHLLEVTREYLERQPAGVKSQLFEIKQEAYFAPNTEDKQDLKSVARRIERVVEARGNDIRHPDELAVKRADARRLAELEAEELREEKQLIEDVMSALVSYKPELEKLLRLRYIDNQTSGFVADELGIDERTYRRWKREAIGEFATMARII